MPIATTAFLPTINCRVSCLRFYKKYLKYIKIPILPQKKRGKPTIKKLQKPSSILWRPNNYRISTTFTGTPTGNTGTKARQSGLIFWRKGNITIQAGKKYLIGIWNQTRDRQTYHISRNSYNEVQNRINEVKTTIKNQITEIIKEFATKEKLTITGNTEWIRHEDWIKGEEYIDQLPKELIIHDTVIKKVYPEGIEFFKGKGGEGGIEVKNYFKNRALHDFSPEISNALQEIANTQARFATETLQPLTQQIKLHLKVMRGMNKVQKETLKTLKSLRNNIEQQKIIQYQ